MDQRMTESLKNDVMRRLTMLNGCREMLTVSTDPAEIGALLRLVGQHGFEVARASGTLAGVLSSPYQRMPAEGDSDGG